MANIRFREYYESKERLIAAADDSLRNIVEYSMTKYCKIPVYESVEDNQKVYISLKPKDQIHILWEYQDLENPTPKTITFIIEGENKKFFPCWNNNKVQTWVEKSSREL